MAFGLYPKSYARLTDSPEADHQAINDCPSSSRGPALHFLWMIWLLTLLAVGLIAGMTGYQLGAAALSEGKFPSWTKDIPHGG